MKYIFIENFTKSDKNQEEKFNDFILTTKWYRDIIHKEIICHKEALLLGFMNNNIDMSLVFKQIKNYFIEDENIYFEIVKKTLNDDNKVILEYETSKKQIRI